MIEQPKTQQEVYDALVKCGMDQGLAHQRADDYISQQAKWTETDPEAARGEGVKERTIKDALEICANMNVGMHIGRQDVVLIQSHYIAAAVLAGLAEEYCETVQPDLYGKGWKLREALQVALREFREIRNED